MEIFLQNTLLWIESSKYLLLFIGCLIEGPIIMIASGFLYSMGSFDFLPMYLVLVGGNFVADIGWYTLGRYGARNTIFKYGHFIGITKERLDRVEKYFSKYHQKIIIISKLTTGFGFAVLVLLVAGIFKVPFKNYVILVLVGGFIWALFLISIGYFFGSIFIVVPNSMKIIFGLIVTIVLIVGIKFIKKFIKKYE